MTTPEGPSRSPSGLRGISAGRLTQILEAAGGPVAALAATWVAALVLAIALSPPHALYILLGFAGAVFSGIFGLGVVLTVPLLLYVPPLVGRDPLSIHLITGATTVQVAVAGLAGALSHVRNRSIKWSLIPLLAGAMAPAALAGAAWSRRLAAPTLHAVFAGLVAAAAVALLLSGRSVSDEIEPSLVPVNRPLAIGAGAALGLLVGTVGVGGGILLIPLMTSVLRVPLRMAIGSSLGVLALTGLSSMIGKAATGQVDWIFAAALVAGALPGMRVGTWIGQRLPVRQLSLALGLVLALLAVAMWIDIAR